MFKRNRPSTKKLLRQQQPERRLLQELSGRLERLAESGAIDMKFTISHGGSSTIDHFWTLNNVLRLREQGLTSPTTWKEQLS